MQCLIPDQQLTIADFWGVPVMSQQLASTTSIHDDVRSIPGLAQWVKGLALP